MADRQAIVAYGLALGMLALAVFYGWQQLRTLRGARCSHDLSPQDHAYFRRQAWLRLSCCGLMLLLGLLIGGAYGLGLEERAQELGRVVQAESDQGRADLTPEQQQFRKLYGAFWITVLVLVLLLVVLAGYDIWAIARYGRRHFLKIRDDRRAMLERQAALYRSQRNGHQ